MKRIIRTLRKQKLFLVCTLLCSMFFVHESCTKLDTSAPSGIGQLSDAEITQKFFNVPANAPAVVKRAAQEMKNRNAETGYVVKFAKENGFPVWDKVILPAVHATTSAPSFSAAAGSSTDSVVIIPVLQQNSNLVSSYIRADVNGTVALNFYRGGDYSVYSFNEVPEDSVNADKAAIQIMLLNRQVFGYTKFIVNDKRLFNLSNNYADTSARRLEVTITGGTGSTGGNNLLSSCVDVIYTTYYNHCPYGPRMCSGPSGSCDWCIPTCASSNAEITTVCGPWGETPDVPGSPSPGSGGGGGSTTPSPFPCPSTQGKNITIIPCTPPTLPPVLPLPDPDPCSHALELAMKMDTLYMKGKVDSMLALIPNFGTNPIEYGFGLYKKWYADPSSPTDTIIGRYYPGPMFTGTDTSVDVLYDYPPTSLIAGWLHTHPASDYPAQSAFDIYAIIRRRMASGSRVEGALLAASDGSRYASTITDYVKAAAFSATAAQYLNGIRWAEDSDIGKAFKQAFEYFEAGDKNKEDFAYEMAMAAVLSEFNAGVTINKMDATGHFKPIMVNVTVPNPNEPNNKIYTQNCL